MKITSYILSIFILIMVAIPCNDAIYTNVHTSEITQITPSFSDHSHDIHDECTPVCSCNCCGTLITLTKIQVFKNITESKYFSRHFSYSFLYSYKFINGIWQPPTLS